MEMSVGRSGQLPKKTLAADENFRLFQLKMGSFALDHQTINLKIDKTKRNFDKN